MQVVGAGPTCQATTPGAAARSEPPLLLKRLPAPAPQLACLRKKATQRLTRSPYLCLEARDSCGGGARQGALELGQQVQRLRQALTCEQKMLETEASGPVFKLERQP